MSIARNKAIVQQFFASFNAADQEAIGKLVANSFAAHNPFPGQEPTRAGMLETMAAIVAAFPDQHTTVEDLIAEGDLVVAMHTRRSTPARPDGQPGGASPSMVIARSPS